MSDMPYVEGGGMRIVSRGRLGRVLAAMMALALALAHPAVASADDIRVLLVPSRDADLDLQISMLERAIAQSRGPLALVGGLTAAHVVIQFTSHRRTTGKDGEPLFHWTGHAKLLKMPEEMTVSAKPLSDRFELLVIGKEGSEAERARELLEKVLTDTLRPKSHTPPREAL
jgi:hypothetical protein